MHKDNPMNHPKKDKFQNPLKDYGKGSMKENPVKKGKK